MTFKQHYATFVLFMWNEHIKEDWDQFLPIAKKILYPFWFVRAISYCILFPLFIPGYIFKQSNLYKNFSNHMELAMSGKLDQTLDNKINTNTFLNLKYGKGFKFKISKSKK